MATVLETNVNSSTPSRVSAMLDIPLEHIQESKTNPRRQFDETKLSELAENIRLHGVLQPVLVRPLLVLSRLRPKTDARERFKTCKRCRPVQNRHGEAR